MDLSKSWVFTITTVAKGAIKLGSDTSMLKIKNIIFWRMWYAIDMLVGGCKYKLHAAETFLP